MGQDASIGAFEPGSHAAIGRAWAGFTRLVEHQSSHEGQLDYVASPDIASDSATPMTDRDSLPHDRVYYVSAGRFALQRWLREFHRNAFLAILFGS